MALPIFPMLFVALFMPAISVIRLGKKWQGKGLMFEALTAAIRYMQRTQHIHRIMANYMPHNKRSGDLLARLGFEKEGYAKDYLLIDGQWRDHVLTALTTPDWTPGR
ncbi:GNAT family N-acetyltransferase [Escherichia coli]